jgi:serine/threonine protein kinase
MSARAPVQVGRYLLFKSLKKGGMARVFLGYDRADPERLVAVKTLLPALGKKKLFQQMFKSEGKVGLRLEHPNIVRTLEAGTHGETPFIAMEFIFGYDLSTILRRMRKQAQVLPLPLACGIARDIAFGLAYAHELIDEHGRPLDIVNRDVSPGNVMLSFEGVVKLIDFGIAQTTIDVKSQIGSIKGKISYMSPEQVRGLPVDNRSDIFSLGTVLYEMLTGVHVFHDEGDFATMERVRRAEAPPPSQHNASVDARLDAIVGRAMARERLERYASAREVGETLDQYLRDRGESPDRHDVQRFLRAEFGEQITKLHDELEAARRETLGGGEADGGDTRPDDDPDSVVSLVSGADDLNPAAASEHSVPPDEDAAPAWKWALAGAAVIAAAAVAWLVSGL